MQIIFSDYFGSLGSFSYSENRNRVLLKPGIKGVAGVTHFIAGLEQPQLNRVCYIIFGVFIASKESNYMHSELIYGKATFLLFFFFVFFWFCFFFFFSFIFYLFIFFFILFIYIFCLSIQFHLSKLTEVLSEVRQRGSKKGYTTLCCSSL